MEVESRFCFFFSSRRRHTRWNCDWSSDVCSSDLKLWAPWRLAGAELAAAKLDATLLAIKRSEERRVGKECRSRWSAAHSTKKRVGTEVIPRLTHAAAI